MSANPIAAPLCSTGPRIQAVHIRGVTEDDTSTLIDHFCRLSDFDRFRRFFSGMSNEGIATMVKQFDWSRMCAVGAFFENLLVSVSELGWHDSKMEPPELAVSTDEHWRKRGLSSLLTREVCKNARRIGFVQARAAWLPGNDGVASIIKGLNGTCWHDGSVFKGEFSLS